MTDAALTRGERIRAAVRAIEARGENPTVGRVQAELGERVTHDMNGRDVRALNAEKEALGWVSERRGGRWYWVKRD